MLNEDDIKRIEEYIEHNKAFRIGGRGICIECYPKKYGWNVYVPRSYYSAYVGEIEVQGNILQLSVEDGYVPCGHFDLYEYTKLTRLIYDL